MYLVTVNAAILTHVLKKHRGIDTTSPLKKPLFSFGS